MIDVIEITINEFEKNFYDKYEKLFPEDEQRDWEKIKNTYNKGIEKFYKIQLDNINIGFFMLEKLNDNYPFYLDYFAIFKEFQNMGYGTKAVQTLIKNVVHKDGIIGEIEKESESNPVTIRRLEFYNRLGFYKIDSEYLLYDVLYTPICSIPKNYIEKKKIDNIFFEYYKVNCGENDVRTKCKIIK